MAATDRASIDLQPQAEAQAQTKAAKTQPAPASRPKSAAQQELARLAQLHREAAETARLANLLGRAPSAGAILGVSSGLTAGLVLNIVSAAALMSWLTLVALGVGALAFAYRRAIRAPFEKGPLTGFSRDLSAILTYAGFAWGAGAFLVLPAGTDAFIALAFALIPPALVAGLLRARSATLPFLATAAIMASFAMVLRPLPGGARAALLTVAATAAIAAVAVIAEKLEPRNRSLPQFAGLPLG
jgi:hypothetical protein